MKLYTKTGDGGETGLFGGKRVSKDSVRVEAYGAVDELNAAIGVILTHLTDADLRERLITIQSALFDLGSELATPADSAVAASGAKLPRVEPRTIEAMESWIDAFDAEVEPLRNFVLPGGSAGGAALHLARTVCRRAERRVVTLAARDAVREDVLRYLNRLSDLLFVMARVANKRAGVAETQWKSGL
jgi:cob(I)alamin adenosyltransferase